MPQISHCWKISSGKCSQATGQRLSFVKRSRGLTHSCPGRSLTRRKELARLCLRAWTALVRSRSYALAFSVELETLLRRTLISLGMLVCRCFRSWACCGQAVNRVRIRKETRGHSNAAWSASTPKPLDTRCAGVGRLENLMLVHQREDVSQSFDVWLSAVGLVRSSEATQKPMLRAKHRSSRRNARFFTKVRASPAHIVEKRRASLAMRESASCSRLHDAEHGRRSDRTIDTAVQFSRSSCTAVKRSRCQEKVTCAPPAQGSPKRPRGLSVSGPGTGLAAALERMVRGLSRKRSWSEVHMIIFTHRIASKMTSMFLGLVDMSGRVLRFFFYATARFYQGNYTR